MASFKPVSALQRGLSVLAVIGRLGQVRASQIQDETGLDKATIIRMLETLLDTGYVSKNSSDGSYSVTGRTVNLSRGFGPIPRLQDLIAPVIQKFRTEVNWPCNFAVPDGDAMFIIENTPDRIALLHRLPADFRPGFLLTSLGLAYLAHCSTDAQRDIIERLASGHSKMAEEDILLSDDASLQRRLSEVREMGYATTDPDYVKRVESDMIWDMAVPVTDHSRVYGALSLFVIKSSISPEEAVIRYLLPLQNFASAVMNVLSDEKAAFPSAPFYADGWQDR